MDVISGHLADNYSVYLLCYKAAVPLHIVGLKPGTHYLLRVRAVNDVGAGTPVIRSQVTENIRTHALLLTIGGGTV